MHGRNLSFCGRGFWRDFNRSGTENSGFVFVLVIGAIFRISSECVCDFAVEHVVIGITLVCFKRETHEFDVQSGDRQDLETIAAPVDDRASGVLRERLFRRGDGLSRDR